MPLPANLSKPSLNQWKADYDECGVNQGETLCGRMDEFLLQVKKYYFVVYKDTSNNTKSSLHKDLNRDLISVKRLAKHPFEKVYIVDPISFEKIMESFID